MGAVDARLEDGHRLPRSPWWRWARWPSESFETAASFTQGGEALGGEALNSFFISASARTAGFTTIDIGGLTVQTLLLIMALMFVGGVSGSTAGGIKINTFATLFATAFSYLRGYKRVPRLRQGAAGDAGAPRPSPSSSSVW